MDDFAINQYRTMNTTVISIPYFKILLILMLISVLFPSSVVNACTLYDIPSNYNCSVPSLVYGGSPERYFEKGSTKTTYMWISEAIYNVTTFTAPEDGYYAFFESKWDDHAFIHLCSDNCIEYRFHCDISDNPPAEISSGNTQYVWKYIGMISGSAEEDDSANCSRESLSVSQFVYMYSKKDTCDITTRVFPTDVLPQKAGSDKTTSTIMVSLNKPAPADGCNVKFTVEPIEQSGGHSHSGSRPKGTVTPNSISFSSGEMGAKNATYKSSEVSGEEKIKVKVNEKDNSETTINVKVPGLEPLQSSIVYNLSQSPDAAITHPSNHYGLPSTNDAVFNMAFDYLYETDALLGINDMSLEKGGLFDYRATWAPPHSSHRKGTSVDINSTAQSTETWKYVHADRALINKYCGKYNGHIVREGPIHCEFTN